MLLRHPNHAAPVVPRGIPIITGGPLTLLDAPHPKLYEHCQLAYAYGAGRLLYSDRFSLHAVTLIIIGLHYMGSPDTHLADARMHA